MILPRQVEQCVEQIAPVELKMDYDNVGLLVDCGAPVRRILVALDATEAVIQEAAETNCEMIVCHHPIIFHPLHRLEMTNPLMDAAKSGISICCAHTNFDAAKGGVNDVLCELFQLEKVEPAGGMGRLGCLAEGPMELSDFAEKVKETLDVSSVQVVDAERPVSRLLVVGGAGGDFLPLAQELGCDTLLTGEAKHHEGLEAIHRSINLVVAGHYETERPAMRALQQALQELLKDEATCVLSQQEHGPFQYL